MDIYTYDQFKDFLENNYPTYKGELSIQCEILNISIGKFKEDKEFFGIRLDFMLAEKYIELWIINIDNINYYHSFTSSKNIEFDINFFKISFDEARNKYSFEIFESEFDKALIVDFDEYRFIEN